MRFAHNLALFFSIFRPFFPYFVHALEIDFWPHNRKKIDFWPKIEEKNRFFTPPKKKIAQNGLKTHPTKRKKKKPARNPTKTHPKGKKSCAKSHKTFSAASTSPALNLLISCGVDVCSAVCCGSLCCNVFQWSLQSAEVLLRLGTSRLLFTVG